MTYEKFMDKLVVLSLKAFPVLLSVALYIEAIENYGLETVLQITKVAAIILLLLSGSVIFAAFIVASTEGDQ